MNNSNWLEIANHQMWLQEIDESNEYTKKFGLTLSTQDAQIVLEAKSDILKQQRRVEFGNSILQKIIFAFCDSPYISQANYTESLIRLQEIFFSYKNEMLDEITDDELLTFMKEQFDTVCFGDLDYLEETCLEIFAQAIRSGYDGYIASQGKGEFEKFDIVQRWDKDLYLEALKELFWR